MSKNTETDVTPITKEEKKSTLPTLNLAELEKIAILEALDSTQGSTSKAAKILGCSVRKIQYRLRAWGLSRPASYSHVRESEKEEKVSPAAA